MESFACLFMEDCFQAGHRVFCNGANQIVVRNTHGPLRTAERREEYGGEVGGTHWGSFLWWHSETDLAGSPRCCSHLCVWTLPSLLTYSTKPSQGLRDTVECEVGCQSYDCKLWYECVWEFRGRVQLICHMWEFEDSSSFTSKIK